MDLQSGPKSVNWLTMCALKDVMNLQKLFRMIVGKPEGKRPLRRPRHRLEDNIKNVSLRSEKVGGAWTGLFKLRTVDRWQAFVNGVTNLRVPYKVGNFLTNQKPFSCSRSTVHHAVS